MRKERKDREEASEREGLEETHIVKLEQDMVLIDVSGSAGAKEKRVWFRGA